MDTKLLMDAVKKMIAGVVLIALMLFLPAGTIRYWNGWLFCAVLFIPVMIMGVVLFLKAPDLLRKRLQEKEEQSEQKTVVALSALMFVTIIAIMILINVFERRAEKREALLK